MTPILKHWKVYWKAHLFFYYYYYLFIYLFIFSDFDRKCHTIPQYYSINPFGVLNLKSIKGLLASFDYKRVLHIEKHIVNCQIAVISILVGVKDPPKRMSVGLAFGAVSKSVYEHRRVSLERYLQVSFSQITQPLCYSIPVALQHQQKLVLIVSGLIDNVWP